MPPRPSGWRDLAGRRPRPAAGRGRRRPPSEVLQTAPDGPGPRQAHAERAVRRSSTTRPCSGPSTTRRTARGHAGLHGEAPAGLGPPGPVRRSPTGNRRAFDLRMPVSCRIESTIAASAGVGSVRLAGLSVRIRSGTAVRGASLRTDDRRRLAVTAVLQGVRVLEVAEHTFVPGGLGPAGRLGRRGHQDRARRAGRRHARPGLRAGMALVPERRPRPARALQPGEAEPGSRPDLARRARDPLQAGRDLRRLPDQQAPERAARSSRSASTRSGPTTPTSSTCAGPARASGARRRQGLVRLPGLLGPVRRGPGGQAPRVRPHARPPGPRVRRLHRGHDHRRRDPRRALPP